MRKRVWSSVAVACLLGLAMTGVAVGAPATTRAPVTGAASPAVTSPLDNQVQQEADRPVPVPATKSCTETIMDHHMFENSYYVPFKGTYTPPTDCPGPWNTVVLTFSSMIGGDEFDRTLDVNVGGAEFLRGSTSEPCCTGQNTISWSVQRDVTADQQFLQTPQPVLVRLDNVNDATYTGVYDSSATLTFYETGPGAPAPSVPTVIPISPLAPLPSAGNTSIDPTFTLGKNGETEGNTVAFPTNMTALSAQLFADGHGSCEEFWWSEPNDCGGGTPYREAAVYLDGVLAGAAPVFPTTFTGADGPGTWEPIPSPRAWNLRPYTVDLTPFVGELTDGAQHSVRLGVLEADYTEGGDGYWPVSAVLLASTSTSSARTTGALTSAPAPALPTDDQTPDPTGAGVSYSDNSSHSLTFSGYTVDGNGNRVTTDVSENMTLASTEPSAATRDSWTWDRSSTTTVGGHTTAVARSATFSLTTTPESAFAFTDNDAGTVTVDGTQTASDSTAENMTTTGAGLAYNNGESEDVGYFDSTGVCYHHTLAAAAGQVVVDRLDGACPGAGPTGALGSGSSASASPTPSASASASPSVSPSDSPSPSLSPSDSPTPSVSPSDSPSPSVSPSDPPTPTAAAAPTSTMTILPSAPTPTVTLHCPVRSSTITVSAPAKARRGSFHQVLYSFKLFVDQGGCKTPSAVGRQFLVYVDGHRVATLRTGAHGTINYLVRLKPGRHVVTASFPGNRDLKKSVSARVVAHVI